jgi:hypothetical protein
MEDSELNDEELRVFFKRSIRRMSLFEDPAQALEDRGYFEHLTIRKDEMNREPDLEETHWADVCAAAYKEIAEELWYLEIRFHTERTFSKIFECENKTKEHPIIDLHLACQGKINDPHDIIIRYCQYFANCMANIINHFKLQDSKSIEPYCDLRGRGELLRCIKDTNAYQLLDVLSFDKIAIYMVGDNGICDVIGEFNPSEDLVPFMFGSRGFITFGPKRRFMIRKLNNRTDSQHGLGFKCARTNKPSKVNCMVLAINGIEVLVSIRQLKRGEKLWVNERDYRDRSRVVKSNIPYVLKT